MKKSISLVLCFTLIVVVFLAKSNDVLGETVGTGSYGKEVRVEMAGVCEVIYQVDISWGDMNFVYTTSGSHMWNENTHLYDENYISQWSASGNAIQLINHSNASITATYNYNQKGLYTGVLGVFEKVSIELPSAEGRPLNDSELKSINYLNLTGVLANTENTYATVGSIKLSIE